MADNSLSERIHTALRAWQKPPSIASKELSFLENLQLLNSYRRAETSTDLPQAFTLILRDALERLQQEQADDAQLLRKRFIEGMDRSTLADARNISVPHLDRLQKAAIDRLAVVIETMEVEAQRQVEEETSHWRTAILSQIDCMRSYDRLFGVDTQLRALQAQLRPGHPPYLVALEGIGGIGKTSLALEYVQSIVDTAAFAGVALVTAQPAHPLGGAFGLDTAAVVRSPDGVIEEIAEQLLPPEECPFPLTADRVLPQLRQLLRRQPYLVVVDNLETVEATETLLATLGSLVRPSKVLLTSREHPASEQIIYTLRLSELDVDSTLACLRHWAKLGNVQTLQLASEADLRRIYDWVGGNPLALRLVVGQCAFLPLDDVLMDLHEVRGSAVERLYDHIYGSAWQQLHANEQKLLLSMLLLPAEGDERTQIEQISGLPTPVVVDGLGRLARYSLVDFHATDAHSGRYTIHSLTRTFLHRQVLEWQ